MFPDVPHPGSQPQRSLDPIAPQLLESVILEINRVIEEVALSRGALGGLRLVHWEGQAADAHVGQLDEASKPLSKGAAALDSLRETLDRSRAKAYEIVADENAAYQRWQTRLEEWAVAQYKARG